jgi:hypothetical protein
LARTRQEEFSARPPDVPTGIYITFSQKLRLVKLRVSVTDKS